MIYLMATPLRACVGACGDHAAATDTFAPRLAAVMLVIETRQNR